MSTQQPPQQHHHNDPNAAAVRLNAFWLNFKQGKVIGYKMMGLLLILIVTAGCIIYILHEKSKAESALWRDFLQTDSETDAQELSKKNPNTIQDRLARLQIARYQLGPAGIEQLAASEAPDRLKAVENIEKAREALKTLLPEFEEDPVFKAECLLGLAKAEASLVAVPTQEGQLNEFKGSVSKVVEYLDQLAQVAAPDTPWAVNSKKMADSLRNNTSATAHEFVRVEQELFRPRFGGDLRGPTSPLEGGMGAPNFSGIPSGPLSPPSKGPNPTPPTPLVGPPAPPPMGPTPPPVGPTAQDRCRRHRQEPRRRDPTARFPLPSRRLRRRRTPRRRQRLHLNRRRLNPKRLRRSDLPRDRFRYEDAISSLV